MEKCGPPWNQTNYISFERYWWDLLKNVPFIEFEPQCQKLWAFMSNFAIFYDSCSPNMAMSRDPRNKFWNIFTFPNSAFNIGKSYKISSIKALSFRSYQPKTSRGEGWKTPPCAFRVNPIRTGGVFSTRLEFFFPITLEVINVHSRNLVTFPKI